MKCSIREVHEVLEERNLERLETWRVECETSGQGLGSATGVEWMCESTPSTLDFSHSHTGFRYPIVSGGWAVEEHSQFVKLRERFFKEGLGTKGGREAAFSRMCPLLPGRDLAAIMKHDDW